MIGERHLALCTDEVLARQCGAGGRFGPNANGGWAKVPGGRPHPHHTADALKVLQRSGRLGFVDQAVIDAAVGFVTRTLATNRAANTASVRLHCATIRTLSVALADERREQARREMLATVRLAARWLIDVVNPDGGWGGYSEEPSTFLDSYHAVWALDTDPLRLDGDARLRDRGREFILGRAYEARADGGPARFWKQAEGLGPSPATTALAVLSLSHGSLRHRDAAREGARWLVREVTRWTGRDGRYEPIRQGPEGLFPAFALCPLACVQGAWNIDSATAAAVASGLKVIDSLWRPALKGWTDGPPPYIGTSRAILSLNRALQSRGVQWAELVARHGSRRKSTPSDPDDAPLIEAWLLGGELTIVDPSAAERARVRITGAMVELVRDLARGADRAAIRVADLVEARRIAPESLVRTGQRLVALIERQLDGTSLAVTVRQLPILEDWRDVETGDRLMRLCWRVHAPR